MTTYCIAGRVVDDATYIGIPNLRVEAWDYEHRLSHYLNVSSTNFQGGFRIWFESVWLRQFHLFERQPKLYFKLFAHGALLTSTENSVLWPNPAPQTPVVIEVNGTGLCPIQPPTVRPRARRQPQPIVTAFSRSLTTMRDRKQQARQVRIEAAELANQRVHPAQINNTEEFRYRKQEQGRDVPSHLANFTKGLPHDNQGLLVRADDYQRFVRGIDSGDSRDFQSTPLGPDGQDGVEFPTWESQLARQTDPNGNPAPVRGWESAGAGLTFDLQGPDAQAVTQPPAPVLDSPELITEMLEVYSMALVRDVPFAKFNDTAAVRTAVERLNNSDWIRNQNSLSLTPDEQARRRGPFTTQTVFRGTTPGDEVGPYLSQFLLMGNVGLGNGNAPTDGYIQYGAIRIDQRVRVATPYQDYMTTWEAWLDVQNGADLRGRESYLDEPKFRFMTTPRDLATYVHYDALYEAYLNAGLTLLSLGVPFDPGMPFQRPDAIDKQQGFAQFGGPHILSLVTEVATRALKAVRYQKFNVHRRARPEALGGLVNRYCNGDTADIMAVQPLVDGLGSDLLNEVSSHNQLQNQAADRSEDANGGYGNSFLLPMAFPEGSPMHPAYGAGHATVAGACVTILKAFFDHGHRLPFCYQPSADGSCLEKVDLSEPLTVEGELNKVASNIAIGRNWAGVHYFTDYLESVRLGETIALGILEEQKLTYGENFSMTVPLFDGGTVRI